MQIQTHILSGWCVANLFHLNARQRAACMIAAVVADVDGLGIFFGHQYYWDFHHKVGHNLFFGILASVILAAWCRREWIKGFLLCLGLFHLHLLMDYWGSGPLWYIYYLWPTRDLVLKNPYAWHLFSWQNLVAFGVLLIWTLWIGWRYHRTPIELIAPRLDRQFAAWLGRRSPVIEANRN